MKDATDKAGVVKKQEGESEDLDKLLPLKDLDDMHDLFWLRHRLTFDPEDEPADSLVSRVAREIMKRLLTSRDVWATKSLAFQVKQERKRTQIAEGLELVHHGMLTEAPLKHTVVNFMHLHAVLMLAYSKAGIRKLASAPAEEPRGSDPCLFVECP